MQEEMRVDLLCLFCRQPLRGEQDRTYRSGDKIECAACGQLNDYDRVIEDAKKQVAEKIREMTRGNPDIRFDEPPGGDDR